MKRLYFQYPIVLILAFLMMNVAARALGSTQPPNPALEGFIVGCEDKPQPCWYGVVPGETTADDQNRMIQEYRYIALDDIGFVTIYESPLQSAPNCQQVVVVRTVDGTNIVVHEIILFDCSAILSGHFVTFFPTSSSELAFRPTLYYAGGSVSAGFAPPEVWNGNPFQRVDYIRVRRRTNLPTLDWENLLQPAPPDCPLNPNLDAC